MVSVTFYNPNTDQRLPVDEIDELMTVREAVDNLIEQNFIPRPSDGQSYTLAIKGKAELSGDDATLASGNIASGDVIKVTTKQRGGR